MKNCSIEELIRGIKHRNNDVFRYLYKEVYPSVHKFIINSKGRDDDAKDIFQESLIIIYKKSCEPDFKISSSIKTYIFSICKNIWYQKAKSNKTLIDNLILLEEEEERYSLDEDFPIDENEINDRLRYSLLQKYFRKIDHACQKILQLFYNGSSHEEISEKLKISSDLSKTRKKICLDKLLKLISGDPDYQKFYGA